MSTIITIRADEKLREALEHRARAQGKTISALVRDILARSLDDPPMGSRSAHLRGVLNLGLKTAEPWRARLAERNWRL